ncbi:DUF6064 family protein [Marinobacter zhanjiangensis]|uniref:MFS transporter permease n=1 Tax=Marinobacter zhanjiangensis TaxID=578215 RepID=A0ABQ3AJK0_9GAMM|nr:DUF6064 family protein [Marinobacter zhanjiangensis]GGY58832.1 hypothetical protein GCM10007071_01220 [Marinobacter zhanjiangensis]
MDALLSYHPRDFLLFSPRVYWALVTGNNESWWPLAILAPLAGVLVVWLIARRGSQGRRLALASAGALWWFVTWSFLWQQYRAINWAVDWAIPALVILGALLLVFAMTTGPVTACRPHRYRIGLMLVIWGTLIHPLGFLLDDRRMQAADTWLLFPDPLALTTLGIALTTLAGWRLALALPVPLLWSMTGGATLLGLESPIGWAMLIAAGIAVAGWLPLTQSQRGTC